MAPDLSQNSHSCAPPLEKEGQAEAETIMNESPARSTTINNSHEREIYQRVPPLNPPHTTVTHPLPASILNTTDTMLPPYPPIGKVAMTRYGPKEVIVTGSDGLFFFRRMHYHPWKPWSQLQRFPRREAELNATTVTGLAVHEDMDKTLRVYCVAKGQLYAFYRPGDLSTGFVVDHCPAFDEFKIKGIPAAATLSEQIGGVDSDRTLRWCLVVPRSLGGLLYTDTTAPSKGTYNISEPPHQYWTHASVFAEHLTEISAVAITVSRVYKTPRLADDPPTEVVAVCINRGRLHSFEGIFNPVEWETKKFGHQDIPIQHPGRVIGNPVLLSDENEQGRHQLDLLVPSAKGGIFRFMRTESTRREWHMVGRIGFPIGFPLVSSLACARLGPAQLGGDHLPPGSSLHAFMQCKGKLYFIKAPETATTWARSRLEAILGPGPFHD
ncbi:hypothetical protein KVR01_008551 [Diaporthe batatas]|uniref:uncharacterized protein n=1 Tax=Diaporthe batatas TaxID=748121 RepID=UPI001D04BF1D|nr:uncharacterized protein KVR01_008551 [Diaporthe batatas]KAG8161564.1 hypothetical protein KVR01_008551 [Diaporthe batatas]